MKAEDLLYRWAAAYRDKIHGDVMRELTGLDHDEATVVALFILEKNGISDVEGMAMAAVLGDALLIGAFAARERMKQ